MFLLKSEVTDDFCVLLKKNNVNCISHDDVKSASTQLPVCLDLDSLE